MKCGGLKRHLFYVRCDCVAHGWRQTEEQDADWSKSFETERDVATQAGKHIQGGVEFVYVSAGWTIP